MLTRSQIQNSISLQGWNQLQPADFRSDLPRLDALSNKTLSTLSFSPPIDKPSPSVLHGTVRAGEGLLYQLKHCPRPAVAPTTPLLFALPRERNNAHSSSSFPLVVLPRIIILFDLLSPIVEIVLLLVVVPAQITTVGRCAPNVPRVSRPGCFIALV